MPRLPRAQALPAPLVSRSLRRFGSASTTFLKTTPLRAFAPWSNAHVTREPTEFWPQSASAPAPPPPDRAALAALEARAEEAREASERAQRELYDASARLKQTEAPVAEARQRHNEASRKVDELLVNLQVAEDALRRAEGTYDPASSSNDAAARAKHGAGATMARLTGEAKAAGEEASRARHALAEKRDALRDAASRRKDAVAAAAAAADEMDDADRALIDADERFQEAHALAIRLGDQHAAARLLGDATSSTAATKKSRDAAAERVGAARAALDAASNAQLRALSLAEQSVADAARLTDAHANSKLECEKAESDYESAVALRDATRAEFRDAVDAASAVRAAAAKAQTAFAGSLERVYAARAGVSLARSAVERAVHVMSDRAAHLDAAVDEQDLASVEKAMTERVADGAAAALDELRGEHSRLAAAVRAAEAALDAEAAAEAAEAEARAARAAAAAADRDTKRVEASWTLAAKVAAAEAAAVEGFSGPEEERAAGLLFANEAARLARELDSAEAEAARERAAEAERVRALRAMEAAKRNRAVEGASEALPKDALRSSSPRSSRGPANNAVPLRRGFLNRAPPEGSDDAEARAVPGPARVRAEETGADEEDEEDASVLTVSEWFS